MDVVLYMRYSSERQNEQSIEGQQRICAKFCEQYGYNIVDVYIDRALSAFHDTCKRVEFQRMITDSEKRQWQGIVVYKLDRFARNRYDSATYKAKLKKNGVRVISATENISDNPEGVLLESVLEGMAEFYSKELSQKITRGMYESAHKCQNIGGVIPLGYKIVDKKLAIDPLTAPIVQEAFRRYADGETVAEICESFNNRGFKTSRGASFNKNSFKSMFKNVRYIGTYTYKDFRVENAVPAIIDRETFETVQRRLRANEQSPAKAKAVVDYILSSKLFCGHCSRPMTGEYGTGRNGKHYYYACSGRKRFKDCTKQNIKKDAIEYTVAKAAMELLNDETIEYYADLAMKANEEEMKNSTLIPSLEQKIKEIDQSISRLLRMVEQGAESHALTERLNELEKEKRATEKRLLKEKSTIIELDREMVVYWLSQFTKGDIDNPEFRRHIIDMLVNSVYVYDCPDGPPELDIGFNLTSGKHARVTLEECKNGSDLSSYAPPIPPNKHTPCQRQGVCLLGGIFEFIRSEPLAPKGQECAQDYEKKYHNQWRTFGFRSPESLADGKGLCVRGIFEFIRSELLAPKGQKCAQNHEKSTTTNGAHLGSDPPNPLPKARGFVLGGFLNLHNLNPSPQRGKNVRRITKKAPQPMAHISI